MICSHLRIENKIKAEDYPRWSRVELRREVGSTVLRDPADHAAHASDSLPSEEEEVKADEHGYPKVSALVQQIMKVDVAEAYSPPKGDTGSQELRPEGRRGYGPHLRPGLHEKGGP